MASRSELLEAYVELTAVLTAAEGWEPSYKRSPATFKRLVREEAKLHASVAEYLHGLSDRVERIVNWHEVQLEPIQAAVVPPESDELFKAERALLYAAAYQHLLELTTIGAEAGELLYNRPIGITSLSDFILESAEKRTAYLVTQVTSTTRKLIRRAINQAIAHGEDRAAAVARIQHLVSNPVRADMIAATESVNAYQDGLARFAKETGAISKTWDALSGACQLCAPLDAKTIAVDDLFVLENGQEVSKPSAHTRCRCGMVYNYPS